MIRLCEDFVEREKKKKKKLSLWLSSIISRKLWDQDLFLEFRKKVKDKFNLKILFPFGILAYSLAWIQRRRAICFALGSVWKIPTTREKRNHWKCGTSQHVIYNIGLWVHSFFDLIEHHNEPED